MTRPQRTLWALGAELWCSANYHVAREDCLVGLFGRLDNILGTSVKIVVSSLWAPEERCPQFGGSSSPYFRSSFVERQNIGQLVYGGRFNYVGAALSFGHLICGRYWLVICRKLLCGIGHCQLWCLCFWHAQTTDLLYMLINDNV